MSSKIYFMAVFILTAILFVDYCSTTGKLKVTGTTPSMSCITTEDSKGNVKTYDIFVKNKGTTKVQLFVERDGKLHELPSLPKSTKYATDNGKWALDLNDNSYSEQKAMEIVPAGDKHNLFELP